MKEEKLKELLNLHKLWIKGSAGGKRLDLHGANLQYANLRGADLRDANLGANLRATDLRDADLRDANLQYADLRDANLQYADLHGANLQYAELLGADLRGADLSQANTNMVRGVNIHSIDNVGTYNGKITYVPSLDIVYAGCWRGTSKEFILKCAEVIEENDTDLHLDIALSMIQQFQERYNNEEGNNDE